MLEFSSENCFLHVSRHDLFFVSFINFDCNGEMFTGEPDYICFIGDDLMGLFANAVVFKKFLVS